MNKDDYFRNLEDIITDPMFIGISTEDLDQEISNNMWCITLDQNLATEISTHEYVDFFKKVIRNRQDQIKNSNQEHGMIFYLWFDRMASQLRFNLISDVHEKLPFQCDIEILDNIDPIIEECLNYPFPNGLPIKEYPDSSAEKPHVLKVYRTDLII